MDKRKYILEIAANLIHEHGYNNLGIKKILDEAKIPKGSFYHYFESKEDLALSVIDYHIENTRGFISTFEKNLDGLRAFFNSYFKRLTDMEYKRGCAIGNLALELSDEMESARLKLLEWFSVFEDGIYEMLLNSNLEQSIDERTLASFIVSAFEGVILKAKLEKNQIPIEEFEHYVFKVLLKVKED